MGMRKSGCGRNTASTPSTPPRLPLLLRWPSPSQRRSDRSSISRRSSVRARLGTALAVLCSAFHAQAVDAPCPPTAAVAVLIRCAQANSEQVSRARAELDAARARRDVAGRLLPANPTIEVGVGRRQSQDGSTDIDRGVELSQTVEIGGQRGARISAADADLRAAAAIAAASARLIAAEVLSAAAQVVRARRGLALVRDQGEVAERLVRVSHARADK